MKRCKFCFAPIKFSFNNLKQKWEVFNPNNTIHVCLPSKQMKHEWRSELYVAQNGSRSGEIRLIKKTYTPKNNMYAGSKSMGWRPRGIRGETWDWVRRGRKWYLQITEFEYSHAKDLFDFALTIEEERERQDRADGVLPLDNFLG